jgi:hypothetical protein
MRAAVDPAMPNGYQQWPGFSGCMESLRQLLEHTLTTADLAPHVHAPFHSNSICFDCQAVINIDAADNAPANAAGIALHAVQNKFSPAPPAPQDVEIVTAPAGTPSAPVTLPGSCIYNSGSGYVTVIKSWGADVLNNVPNSVKIRANILGVNDVSTPPLPSISSAQQEEQQPTMVIIKDNGSLSFTVQNLDPGTAALIQISWCGWRIPVRRFENTLKSMMSKPGYGADC